MSCNDIYHIAAAAATDVYRCHVKLGTTEYYMFHGEIEYRMFRGCRMQVLAFAGTNEAGDWLKNLSMWSSEGVKKSAADAARKVGNMIVREPGVPLLVTGHSKGAAEAIAYNKLFGATWCVAFCPARCLRYWTNREMPNTTIFIDPNDPVPKLACLSFGHPVCYTIKLPDDFPGLRISDHFMDHIKEYLNEC